MTAVKADLNDLGAEMRAIALASRRAASVLARATPEQKSAALREAAHAVRAARAEVLAANAADMAAANEMALSSALLDRLLLNEQRVDEMAAGLETVAAIPDPV